MSNEVTREGLIKKIRAIEENQRFKQDAFFFCGFPTDKPNETMLAACQKYLTAIEGGQEGLDEKAQMLAEMEKEAAAVPEVAAVNNILSEENEIKLILDNRDLL